MLHSGPRHYTHAVGRLRHQRYVQFERAALPGNGTDAAPCSGSIQWGASGSVLCAHDVELFPSDSYRLALDATSMTSTQMISGDNFLYAGSI